MADSLDFIPSKASAIKNEHMHFETVVYESYKPKEKRKTSTNVENKMSVNQKKENEWNIKQAKNEIIKLGMSGLNSQEKEEAKVNLLIKLGAKPPKKKNQNYKQLQMDRKKLKTEEMKKQNFLQLGKNTQGKSTAKGKSFDRKRKKEKADILSIYGKVKQTTKN